MKNTITQSTESHLFTLVCELRVLLKIAFSWLNTSPTMFIFKYIVCRWLNTICGVKMIWAWWEHTIIYFWHYLPFLTEIVAKKEIDWFAIVQKWNYFVVLLGSLIIVCCMGCLGDGFAEKSKLQWTLGPSYWEVYSLFAETYFHWK